MSREALYKELLADAMRYIKQEYPDGSAPEIEPSILLEMRQYFSTPAARQTPPPAPPKLRPAKQPLPSLKKPPLPVKPKAQPPKDQPIPKKERIIPEQIAPKAEAEFSSLKKWLANHVPQLKILEAIPSDAKASQRKKGEILIVAKPKSAEERVFIENLVKAVDTWIAPAEADGKLLPHHQLLIAPEEQMPEIKGDVESISMRPISDYLTKPEFKKKLWQAILSHYMPQ